MFVTASNELKFHYWPTKDVDETFNPPNTSNIVCISWSNDNNFIIYLQEGGYPEILNLKNIKNIKQTHIITAIDNATCAIFRRSTKRIVAIGTVSSTVALYDTKNKSIGKLFTVAAAVTHLDFNADDEYLVVACEDGSISLLNIADGTETRSYSVGCLPCTLRFHPNQREIFAVGTTKGALYKYDVNKQDPSYKIKCHNGRITGIVFSAKNDLIITAGTDCKFCTHDIHENKCVFKTQLEFSLTSMDITPDGTHLAIGTEEGAIFIYEMKNLLTPVLSWRKHNASVRLIKFGYKKRMDTICSSLESLNTTEATSACNKVVSLERVETTDTLSPEKLQQENEFKLLYDKFINKTDEDTVLPVLKESIVHECKKDIDKVHIQMVEQTGKIQDFFRKEFEKLTSQLEEQWSILDMVAGNKQDPREEVAPATTTVTAATVTKDDTERPMLLDFL